MEHLPVEILHEVVSYLPADDLDSMRLVSHGLSAADNVFKYRVLHVSATRESLNHLLCVSRQPEMALCVREIVYPWQHVSPIEEAMEVPEDWDIVQHATFTAIAAVFWNWYNAKYTTQLDLEDSGECAVALEKALSRIPNIRVLCQGYTSNITRFDEWKYSLIDGSIWMWIPSWIDKYLCAKLKIESEERVAKHFLDFINVSNRVGLKPYKLGASTCTRLNPLWYGFFSNSSRILPDRKSLLVNITSISFSFGKFHCRTDVESFKKEVKERTLYNFYLRPQIFGVHSTYLSQFLFLDILGRTRIWKYLHTFRIHSLYVNSKELAHFLTCHSKTLKCLEMDVSILFGGKWRDYLDLLNEELQLAKFKLESASEEFESYDGRREYANEELRKMEAYVLHEGPPFPPTVMELEEQNLNFLNDLEAQESGGEGLVALEDI
ncbi:hypothetical protein RUND412_009999 [Rhizina undulata]